VLARLLSGLGELGAWSDAAVAEEARKRFTTFLAYPTLKDRFSLPDTGRCRVLQLRLVADAATARASTSDSSMT
jgi:hypothetical protein